MTALEQFPKTDRNLFIFWKQIFREQNSMKISNYKTIFLSFLLSWNLHRVRNLKMHFESTRNVNKFQVELDLSLRADGHFKSSCLALWIINRNVKPTRISKTLCASFLLTMIAMMTRNSNFVSQILFHNRLNILEKLVVDAIVGVNISSFLFCF